MTREYNIIMSDYLNHCVYVLNQEGEQIHKFGKEVQGIGQLHHLFGIALDNIGHIIVVCEKDTNCLQFFEPPQHVFSSKIYLFILYFPYCTLLIDLL